MTKDNKELESVYLGKNCSCVGEDVSSLRESPHPQAQLV